MLTVHTKGAAIPALGFGTWPMRGEVCVKSVTDGLKLGYPHVDTAQGYDNEAEVGEGIAASGVPRDRIFITTKVRPEWTSAKLMGKSVEDSLRKLRTDRVDLLLAHWPNPAIPVAETVKALSEMKRQGLTRQIGLSNHTVALLDEAIRVSPEPIVTNQIEYHPFVDQAKLVAACRRHGIAITAYCPLALGRVAGDAVLEEIGKAHAKSAAQVTLRWLLQQGDVIAIPKSAHRERLEENLAVFDFSLTVEEMARITELRRPGFHLINEPAWVAKWD